MRHDRQDVEEVEPTEQYSYDYSLVTLEDFPSTLLLQFPTLVAYFHPKGYFINGVFNALADYCFAVLSSLVSKHGTKGRN